MRHLFGAEPALGLFVLLVSLPIVAALAYIAVYGVVQDPIFFLAYFCLYAVATLIGHGMRLSLKRRNEGRTRERSAD